VHADVSVFSHTVVIVAALSCSAHAEPAGNDQIKAILDQIKKIATLKFSPTSAQYAIDAAEFEAQRITQVSFAASANEAALNATIAAQLKADGKFKNPKSPSTNK
jgi:hypothetical protein